MKAWVWLTRDEILAIHDMMLAQYGGRSGLRDAALLESALHRPRHLARYRRTGAHALAAAYAVGIVGNHPFVDGNKRTGFIAAAVFLESNGLTLTAPEESVVQHTLALAAGDETAAGYARWLRRWTA